MNPIFTKLNKLHKNYVPSYGEAKTVYGEILRAYGRLVYRFYNDGDMFFKGYGVDTCGSSLLYLSDTIDGFMDSKLANAIRKWKRDSPIYDDEDQYEKMLIEVGKLLYAFLISENGEHLKDVKNRVDSRSEYYQMAMKKWDIEEDEDDYDDEY